MACDGWYADSVRRPERTGPIGSESGTGTKADR